MERLFDFGMVGTMSDAHLLDWFVSRNDEAVESVFRELVIRHGPMVLRICRNLLHNQHDAEDAFQAVFLVLANRAASIRRRKSVASWLFGVAQRAAIRVKRSAARQRSLAEHVAELASESYVPVEKDPDWDILYEEIGGLPERLRTPVVLCYLEGLTQDVVSHRLGLSETTIRGRLSQARDRLRYRLTKRGIAVPATLIASGAVGQLPAHSAMSTALVHSTIRVALGFMAGGQAAVLARGVLDSMLLKQLKFAGLLLLLGTLGSVGVWRTLAATTDDRHQVHSQVIAQKTGARASAPPKPKVQTSTVPCRMTGEVRVEGTREPVAGAKFLLASGDIYMISRASERSIITDAEGRFSVDLAVGNARIWLSDAPVGYWVPNTQKFMESLVITPKEPHLHREYVVRKGTVWNFRFVGRPDQRPFRGSVVGYNSPESFRTQANDSGRAQLTLPTEGRKLTLAIREYDLLAFPMDTGQFLMNLEWESNFRPDDLKEMTRVEGNHRQLRLVDHGANSALIQAPDSVQPVNENGKLVIRVTIPDRRARVLSAVTGQVIDEKRQPIEGAKVALMTMGRVSSDDSLGQALTDAQGRYRLLEVPYQGIDGNPLNVRLAVTKKGYAGLEVPLLSSSVVDPQKPQIAEPIQLEPGASVSGIVVDHLGQPAVGASVRSNQPNVQPGVVAVSQAVQTDKNGRFALSDLHRGISQFITFYGKTRKSLFLLIDGPSEEVRIHLPEHPPEFGANINAMLAGPPKPPAEGLAAPEWQVIAWSDSRDHKLADARGKILVLYFWGVSWWQSVSALPALQKVVDRYGPRGVDFLAVHNAEADEQDAQRLALKVLAFKGAKITTAIDRTRILHHARGLTAQDYGVTNYPVIVVIDRAGKIAYRNDTADRVRNPVADFQKILTNPPTMTEDKVNQSIEKTLGKEIDKILK